MQKTRRETTYFSSDFKLGVLGGGQLGKMLLQETMRMDVFTAVLDPSPDAPCCHYAPSFTTGDLKNFETVYNFGKKTDLLTIEIEHVNVEALEKLESEGLPVYPPPSCLRIIQDKRYQKAFYHANDIPTSGFYTFETISELDPGKMEFPCVYKSAREGYDGRGVKVLKSANDLEGLEDVPGLIEEFIGEMKEISVIVSRNKQGEMAAYPPVEMEFHPTANLVEFLFSPSSLDEAQSENARMIAEKVAEKIGLIGIMAVEMFVTKEGKILVNESAPRPHNSGHQTIEGNLTSQYEQHLRAILGLPPGSVRAVSPSVMVNLLGAPGYDGPVYYEGMEKILAIEGVYPHLYGKTHTRPFRKMGHVTIVDKDLKNAIEKAKFVKETLKVISWK